MPWVAAGCAQARPQRPSPAVTADAWCASTLTPILKAKRAVESTSEIDVKDFSNVADLLPEPMVVVDLQSGSLLGVNATAKRILDLQRGSEWLTRVQDVDALMAFLSEARRVRQMLPGSLVIKSQAELSRHRIRAAHMDRSSPAKVLIRIGPSEMDRRLKTLNTRLAIRVILPAGVGTFPEQAPEPPAKALASITGKIIVAFSWT